MLLSAPNVAARTTKAAPATPAAPFEVTNSYHSGIVAAQMQAVAQVADLVVALDELLAQPLRGVTNKLGAGITANADTTSPV
jgi:hypothetical protein